MKVTVEPTPTIEWFIINGGRVPLRVWKGTTDRGSEVEVLALCITALDCENDAAIDKLYDELPPFMQRDTQLFHIETNPAKIRAKWIHDTGREGPPT